MDRAPPSLPVEPRREDDKAAVRAMRDRTREQCRQHAAAVRAALTGKPERTVARRTLFKEPK